MMHRLMTWESAVVPAEGEHFCIVSANLGLLPTVIYFCENEVEFLDDRSQQGSHKLTFNRRFK